MAQSADVDVNHDRYMATIKALRLRNFSKGLPLLILSDKLPEGQVYRAFSDGRIELQEVFTVGPKFESKVIYVLKSADADQSRREYGLL